MIYAHHASAPWDSARWPNFTRAELACGLSGEYYHWPEFLDRLQAARRAIGAPFRINSAHRSYLHNYRVGGAPASQHLRLAMDISLHGHDRHELRMALREAGFTGFGYYNSFIHIDLGRPRFWFGAGAKSSWQSAQFSA
ncbi:MAG: D-Ala-D-Ala carboxypeptidase family metallohydrolase [Maricaulaceae bacterium]